MDCHDNHRYHPYAPPANVRSERYREWFPRDHAHFSNDMRGMRNYRFRGGHRGVGNLQRPMERGQMHQLPEAQRPVRPHEERWDPRFKGLQRGPSPEWSDPGEQSVMHSNVASLSRASPIKESSHIDSAPSPQKSCSPVGSRDAHTNTTCSIPVQIADGKHSPALDTKNPSVVKIAPFSHQPLLNNNSKPSTSSSVTPNTSNSETSTQTKPSNQTFLNCGGQLTAIRTSQVDSEGQTVMTVLAPSEDGQLRQLPFWGVTKTICSCQLRQRKYVDKGKSNDDPIVIDSDEEGEKNNNQSSAANSQDGETSSTTCSTTTCKPSYHEEHLFQVSPRKRAKMSTDSGLTLSLMQEKDLAMPEATDISTQMTESMADMASRIADRLRQSGSEGSSSSASSDSLSSVASSHITEDAPLLANPQILHGMLNECDQTTKPYKKLKTSPRNLFTAAKSCNIHKVLALLVEGCDPNLQVLSAKGKTAMHAAASGGYVDIMACLKLAGCDLNLMDFENRTPIFDAVSNHKVKAVEYLIDSGAILRGKDSHGMTCFHLATRQGHTDLISLLLRTGQFDINQKDDGGWTPIMWAAEDKHMDATRLLVDKGANVHIRDLELNVPLHWAVLSGNLEVCKLLLDERTDINCVNKRQETPLYIAAREDNYACVQLLISRGANIHIENKEGYTPVQIALVGSRTRHFLESKEILESCQETMRPRVLHSDISRGQENVSIPCLNEVDGEPYPEFRFVKECCEIGGGTINWDINKVQGCLCEGSCRSGKACSCSERSDGQRIWYSEDGLLIGEIKKFDRPLLFECNRMCNCWMYCKNRVVQKGMLYPLQLYRTLSKGWGVRSLATIPMGSFVCEYTGELISDMEADARDDDSYLFDLDCKESCDELYCIDAKNYGNISRFINHSCEPNIFPIRVFIHHRDIRFPRIAFFAKEEINQHDEICFDYGDRFWAVKKKEFYCECGTLSCKYRNPNS